MFFAQRLTVSGAIHIGDQCSGRVREVSHQLVPKGLQALAMASPRCLELNEDGLSGCLLIEIRGRQLDGTNTTCQEKHGRNCTLHGAVQSDLTGCLGC
eukprot:290154_1